MLSNDAVLWCEGREWQYSVESWGVCEARQGNGGVGGVNKEKVSFGFRYVLCSPSDAHWHTDGLVYYYCQVLGSLFVSAQCQ